MFQSNEKDRTLIINFDKIITHEQVKNFNIFNFSLKNSYFKAVSEILIFLEDLYQEIGNDVIFTLFKIKSTIDLANIYKEEHKEFDFKSIIKKELLNNGELIDKIFNIVEKDYVDLKISSANKNEELQITNEHCKDFFVVSSLHKLVIMFSLHYGYMNNLPTKDLDDLIFELNYDSFDYIDKLHNCNLRNKLFKLIKSRVDSTKYSDKVILGYLESVSIDTDILANNIFHTIIKNTIFKIERSRSLVSFLHSIIKNQINYQYKVKLPYNYKPVNLNLQEGINEFESYNRCDETSEILINIVIQNIIKNNIYNLSFPDDEIEYYKTRIKVNLMNLTLLRIFLVKELKSFKNLNIINHTDFIKLSLIMKNWFIENNLNSLAEIVLSTSDNSEISWKMNFNRSKFISTLLNNERAVRLFTMYNFIAKQMMTKNPIVNLILNLNYNTLIVYPSYQEYQNGIIENKSIDSNKDLDAITEEVLTFLEKRL